MRNTIVAAMNARYPRKQAFAHKCAPRGGSQNITRVLLEAAEEEKSDWLEDFDADAYEASISRFFDSESTGTLTPCIITKRGVVIKLERRDDE